MTKEQDLLNGAFPYLFACLVDAEKNGYEKAELELNAILGEIEKILEKE